MTTNDQDLRALTYLAGRLRDETHGCGPWDAAGTFANLKAELLNTSLLIACQRVIGHATDPEAKTPGAIKRPFTPTPGQPTPTPPKPDEVCLTCGKLLHVCAEVGCKQRETRPRPGVPPTPSVQAARARLSKPRPREDV